MWSALPDEIVARIATLAPGPALGVIPRLERRCAVAVAERRRRLEPLRLAPFHMQGCDIYGTADARSTRYQWNTKLGDEHAVVLAEALASGALAAVKRLHLENTGIRVEGMLTICAALTSGALPLLEELFIDRNTLEVHRHVSAAHANLPMNGGGKGPPFSFSNADSVAKGVNALSAALEAGALQHLKRLDVGPNFEDTTGFATQLLYGHRPAAYHRLIEACRNRKITVSRVGLSSF